jgi:hypothetical protein
VLHAELESWLYGELGGRRANLIAGAFYHLLWLDGSTLYLDYLPRIEASNLGLTYQHGKVYLDLMDDVLLTMHQNTG